AFNRMSTLKDSLFQAKSSASLDLYAAREQLTQKDVELNAVQKELAIKSLQRERLIVVLGIICLLFALVVLYIRLSDIRATNERVEAHNQTLSSYARELEELAFVVSHNLRETSRNINSYSGLLAKKAGASLDEKSRGYLSNVQQAAVRSYEMLVDLETYVGIGKSLPVSQCVDMNLLVEQEGKEFMNTYQLPEQTIAQEKLPRMQAHPALIQILFRCLYENAAKYRSQKPLRIHISYQIAAASHVIRFSDNGIGLNEAYAEKIFRVFQRLHTQDEIPGTGIGLALAAKIMRVYGGTISVQSQEGNGASFSMSFPFSVVGNKELKYPSKPIFRPL
ncbi:MAG: ATP-binding protein, partial [Bacteroidia bacterium]|nr:ATP-binding protein [Bacteroidia bacterium]